ncbi:hypothetical protein OAX78_00275 [Planctomycetota bacterium]|nr:hypothetical protein [Planctomycetota bacterium]
MTTKRIRRIGVFSSGMVSGALGVATALFGFPFYAGLVSPFVPNTDEGFVMALLIALLIVLAYGVASFLIGVFYALFVNLALWLSGGFPIEFSR